MQTDNETVISGLRWSVVSAVGYYSPSATSATPANWHGLLICGAGGVNGNS